MSTRIPTLQTIVNPTGLDRSLGQIATQLSTRISWLTTYGLAQKIVEPKGTFPVLYEENGLDHFSMYPNENMGNFSYFERTDNKALFNEWSRRKNPEFKEWVGLVVWGDLRTIYPADWQQRTREHVKAQVVQELKNIRLTFSQINLLEVFYEGVNIYRGHSISEIDSQFLMRPFVGFRIEFEIHYNNENLC